MNLVIQPAADADLSPIFSIIQQAMACFKENGIDQWQNDYPTPQDISLDIQNGRTYVAKLHGDIVGTAALCFGEEPDYRIIKNGNWRSAQPYAAIHRVAVDGSLKGQGIAPAILHSLIDIAQHQGIGNIRIDTHPDNRSMQRMLEKLGFVQCGTISLSRYHNAPRLAYDYLL